MMIVNGVARPNFPPQSFGQTLDAPTSPLYGHIFAFYGYIHQNQGFNIKIPDALFNLVPNQILVPTLFTILTKLIADTNLEMFGPYKASDQGTNIVRAGTSIPTPFTYINVFLATDVTTVYLFNYIYPQMVNDNVEDQCQYLI